MKVHFNEGVGRVKPMHAANNGPVGQPDAIERGEIHPFTTNFNEFKNSGIPYARTHDTSFYYRYGQEHVVDVYYVFPDFDADPTKAENYDFTLTDEYVRTCELCGVEVFYRLGHRIEHETKKYGIHPPKDFKKWAVICEHIIRHYTEGWADGFKFKMEYWEIWNEPDLFWSEGKVSPTWSGTMEQFFEFYHIVANHLKENFPHLKIGGPAIASNLVWTEHFLKQLRAPLDFFSWHCYAHTVEKMLENGREVRELLDKYGYEKTESILNEWNYVLGWEPDQIVYSHDNRGKIKGAAFSAAAMCASQYSSIDMLMYYDARPNELWNGLFDFTVIGRVLKGYYPFLMFNTLYRLGECVRISEEDSSIYACAAKGDGEAAVMITHFNDDDSTAPKESCVELCGFGGERGTEVEIYALDREHDNELVFSGKYYSDKFDVSLALPNFTTYLVKLKNVK